MSRLPALALGLAVATALNAPSALARPVSPVERQEIEQDVRQYGFWPMNFVIPGITQILMGEPGRGAAWMAGSWGPPIVGFVLSEWLFGKGYLIPSPFRTQSTAPLPDAGFVGAILGGLVGVAVNFFGAQDAYKLEVERQIAYLESLPNPSDVTSLAAPPLLHWHAATGWQLNQGAVLPLVQHPER